MMDTIVSRVIRKNYCSQMNIFIIFTVVMSVILSVWGTFAIIRNVILFGKPFNIDDIDSES